MHAIGDLRPQHRRALAQAGEIIAGVGPGDLARSTPCAGWDLQALLTHMIGQNDGFAAAVTTGDAPRSAYSRAAVTASDLASEWHRSADRLLAAFAHAHADDEVLLIEINPGSTFPVAAALGMHMLDIVIHTWDVASSVVDEPLRRQPEPAVHEPLQRPLGQVERVAQLSDAEHLAVLLDVSHQPVDELALPVDREKRSQRVRVRRHRAVVPVSGVRVRRHRAAHALDQADAVPPQHLGHVDEPVGVRRDAPPSEEKASGRGEHERHGPPIARQPGRRQPGHDSVEPRVLTGDHQQTLPGTATPAAAPPRRAAPTRPGSTVVAGSCRTRRPSRTCTSRASCRPRP